MKAKRVETNASPYGFIFSDNIQDWIRLGNKVKKNEYDRAYQTKKRSVEFKLKHG